MSELIVVGNILRLSARLLIAVAALAPLAAHADNSLRGLEMDVMEPGESAAHATARIALPRPNAAVDGSVEYRDLDTEQRVRAGVGATNDGPGIQSTDTGEPTLAPGGGGVDGDIPGGTIGDGGVIVVEPGEESSETTE